MGTPDQALRRWEVVSSTYTGHSIQQQWQARATAPDTPGHRSLQRAPSVRRQLADGGGRTTRRSRKTTTTTSPRHRRPPSARQHANMMACDATALHALGGPEPHTGRSGAPRESSQSPIPAQRYVLM
jgi:hypothetical protein